MFFLGETKCNRPTGIIIFFAITQEGVDQSFASSNSADISIRRFYVQNFITIGLAFEELSCIRPITLTDSIVYSLFEYTKMRSRSSVVNDNCDRMLIVFLVKIHHRVEGDIKFWFDISVCLKNYQKIR